MTPEEVRAERERLLDQIGHAEAWIADPETSEELRAAARVTISNYRRSLAALPETTEW